MKKIVFLLFGTVVVAGIIVVAITKYQKAPTQKEVQKESRDTSAAPVIIILSPHFDDAALSLGGLIARHDFQTIVATFFGGKPALILHTKWDAQSGFSNSDEAVTARVNEDESALLPLGVTIKNFDYLDFQYRTDRSAKKRIEVTTQLQTDIAALIAAQAPHPVFVYGPATFGKKITHPDHQMLHDAFVQLAKTAHAPNVVFYLYEDFPYTLAFTRSQKKTVRDYVSHIDRLSLEPHIISLSKDELTKKISAIDAYTSQVRAFYLFGDDIATLANKFSRHRCSDFSSQLFACEMVYRIY